MNATFIFSICDYAVKVFRFSQDMKSIVKLYFKNYRLQNKI